MPESAASLLVRITRCRSRALQGGRGSCCSAVVRSQEASGAGDYQVPEPWSGNISRALVLFVSSNPSIDSAEAYPAGSWDDERRIDFFAGRFDQRIFPGSTSGCVPCCRRPRRGTATMAPVLGCGPARASELARPPGRTRPRFRTHRSRSLQVQGRARRIRGARHVRQDLAPPRPSASAAAPVVVAVRRPRTPDILRRVRDPGTCTGNRPLSIEGHRPDRGAAPAPERPQPAQ